MIEEFPWAIFAKGPACTKTGVPCVETKQKHILAVITTCTSICECTVADFQYSKNNFFLKVYIALGNGQADPTLLLETDKSRGLHKVFHIGGFPVLIVNLIFLINWFLKDVQVKMWCTYEQNQKQTLGKKQTHSNCSFIHNVFFSRFKLQLREY